MLINIPDEWRKVKVYNDINKDLYTTFKVLQDREGEGTEPGQDQDRQQEISPKESDIVDCQGQEVLKETRRNDENIGMILCSLHLSSKDHFILYFTFHPTFNNELAERNELAIVVI